MACKTAYSCVGSLDSTIRLLQKFSIHEGISEDTQASILESQSEGICATVQLAAQEFEIFKNCYDNERHSDLDKLLVMQSRAHSYYPDDELVI